MMNERIQAYIGKNWNGRLVFSTIGLAFEFDSFGEGMNTMVFYDKKGYPIAVINTAVYKVDMED